MVVQLSRVQVLLLVLLFVVAIVATWAITRYYVRRCTRDNFKSACDAFDSYDKVVQDACTIYKEKCGASVVPEAYDVFLRHPSYDTTGAVDQFKTDMDKGCRGLMPCSKTAPCPPIDDVKCVSGACQ